MSEDKQWLYPVPGMHVYRDVICMPDTTPSVLSWMENELNFEKGDVLLCAYPCSGDVWLQEIVWHMLNLDKAGQEKATIGRRVPHIDHEFFNKQHPKDFFANSAPPRVFKSRMPANILQRHLASDVNTIFWTMDPRDTLLKYHHLYTTKGKHLNFPPIEFDKFFELFQEKQLFEGDWFDTTKSFLPYIGRGNFLFLKYEDESSDIKGTVRKVADFLGIALREDQIVTLAEVCPFDARPGRTGKYTAEMTSWFKAKYQKEMEGTILENTYM